jgi:subtilisin family serine protease
VLDTGVDSSHPFLQGKVVEEACFSTSDAERGARSLCPNGRDEQHGRGAAAPCSIEGCEHGTHVAGIAAGRGDDFAGIASDATIIAIQVFQNNTDSCTGDGCLNVRTSDIIRALEWVYKLRDTYKIAAVNMSFGSAPITENENEDDTEACDRYSTALYTMVDTLRDADIVTIAATGNHSETAGISFPACLSNVISVGAANTGARSMQVEEVAPFSNSHAAVDLLAPGVAISSAVPGGAFRSLSGTSMAVPAVVGAWAVLKSSTPDATPTTLLQVLQETGVPISDPRTATEYPRIQLNAALNALQYPTAAIPAPPRNLKARLSRQAQVALTWEHTHSVDSTLHLTIERTQEGSEGERWTTVDAVAGDSTTASDTSELACDTRYLYHIRAFSSDGAFVYSNTTSAHMPPCVPKAAPERETRHTLYLASVRK